MPRERFWGLRGREERREKRRLRQELRDLRRDNLHMTHDEFVAFAQEEMQERYAGIDTDALRQLLELILEYLPKILALFGLGGMARSTTAAGVLLFATMIPTLGTASDFLATIPGAAVVIPTPPPAIELEPVFERSRDGGAIPLPETDPTPGNVARAINDAPQQPEPEPSCGVELAAQPACGRARFVEWTPIRNAGQRIRARAGNRQWLPRLRPRNWFGRARAGAGC